MLTPERWQKVRDVLEQAMELAPEKRPRFLDVACSSDPSLRSEVQSLLLADEEARSSFLESPPLSPAALAPGTKLGECQIVSQIGSGGMGVVYRAKDLRLGRDVAIKVLPAHLSSDAGRLRRFEQEAQSAAALNHPNILAVHQLGTYEGAPYLVSELLEGETLREELKQGAVPQQRAMDYAEQIADGLNAAHEKGIIHRDLKPENLFVTKENRIKILDFGLAKLALGDSDSAETVATIGLQTHPGMIAGTVGYMSPEQVRGEKLDTRSDLFSFGVVLYEMATGKRPFDGDTSGVTFEAILNRQPAPPTKLNNKVTPGLENIISKALEKDRDVRYQHASDIRADLKRLKRDTESGHTAAHSMPAIPKPRALSWVGAMTAGILAFVLGGYFLWDHIHKRVPQVSTVLQLTNDGVSKRMTYLATDGSRLYFTEGEDLAWRIVQVSDTGGDTVPLELHIPHPRLMDIAPDFSGLLATSGETYLERPLWFVTLPSGAPRRLGDLRVGQARFFPDGQHFAYTDHSELGIAKRDGSEPQVLFKRDGWVSGIAISPDAQRIRYRYSIEGGNQLWEFNLVDKSQRQLLTGWTGATSIGTGQWTEDGRYFVFYASSKGRSDLWALDERGAFFEQSSHEPIRLTNGPVSYCCVLPSLTSSKIFTLGSLLRGETVRYERAAGQYVPFLSGLPASDVRYSRDGKWFVYVTYPDHALWRSRADGSDRLQLTYPPAFQDIVGMDISPDDAKVAFDATENGIGITYVVGMNGGQPQELIRGGVYPWWSPDGSKLLFSVVRSIRDSTASVFELKSGRIEPIPDGSQKISYGWTAQNQPIAVSSDHSKLWVFDSNLGKWSPILDGPFATGAISPDGIYFYYETDDRPYHKVNRMRISDRHIEPIMEIKNFRRAEDFYYGTALSVTPDGSVLLLRDVGLQEIFALTVNWP